MVRTYFQVVVQINVIYGFVCLIYISHFRYFNLNLDLRGMGGGRKRSSFFIYLYKKLKILRSFLISCTNRIFFLAVSKASTYGKFSQVYIST